MRCSDRLRDLGVRILEVHPEGCEFVCTGDAGLDDVRIAEALESLNFWDYANPLSAFDGRSPWWTGKYDVDDERIFLVMGDPHQEV